MEKLRRLVDECVQRAMVAQQQACEARQRGDAAQAKARRLLDWISERNEQAVLRADERASRLSRGAIAPRPARL